MYANYNPLFFLNWHSTQDVCTPPYAQYLLQIILSRIISNPVCTLPHAHLSLSFSQKSSKNELEVSVLVEELISECRKAAIILFNLFSDQAWGTVSPLPL